MVVFVGGCADVCGFTGAGPFGVAPPFEFVIVLFPFPGITAAPVPGAIPHGVLLIRLTAFGVGLGVPGGGAFPAPGGEIFPGVAGTAVTGELPAASEAALTPASNAAATSAAPNSRRIANPPVWKITLRETGPFGRCMNIAHPTVTICHTREQKAFNCCAAWGRQAWIGANAVNRRIAPISVCGMLYVVAFGERVQHRPVGLAEVSASGRVAGYGRRPRYLPRLARLARSAASSTTFGLKSGSSNSRIAS